MRAVRKKPRGNDQYVQQRRRRFKAFLNTLGLSAAFDAMPVSVRDQFWRPYTPDPHLVFDPSFPAGNGYDQLRRELKASFVAATFEDLFGTTMSVRDYCTILPTLESMTRQPPKEGRVPPSVLQFIELANREAKHWLTLKKEAGLAVYDAVVVPLIARSRIDGRLLHARVHPRSGNDAREPIVVELKSLSPRTKHVTLDGRSRPVFQIVSTNNLEQINWLTWTSQMIGRNDQSDRHYPVYTQSHALQNMQRRLDLPNYSPYLESWMYESLREPNIVRRLENGDLLVESRLQKCRVGYFIVTPMRECAVVRTFLFLTMQPTPESKKIAKQIRLKRHDLDWLGLNRLSAFTNTDLQKDNTIRKLLQTCSCAHLFDLCDVDSPMELRPLAAEMKQYLCLAA